MGQMELFRTAPPKAQSALELLSQKLRKELLPLVTEAILNHYRKHQTGGKTNENK